MPRQPYSEAVKSDRRSGYILRPFVKGEGLGVGYKAPLFARGEQGSRKCLD